MEEEDKAADRIQSFTKWLDDAWAKSSKLGKLIIVILFVSIASPFILGVFAVVIVWYWILPYTITVTDKILAFGFLFSLLTALSLKVGSSANSILFQTYLTRKKKRVRAKRTSAAKIKTTG